MKNRLIFLSRTVNMCLIPLRGDDLEQLFALVLLVSVVLLGLRVRRLGTTLCAADMRSALHRVPDLSPAATDTA